MSEQDAKDGAIIEIAANGPLIIKGVDKMKDAQGEELATKPVMALCRCGASANKPFCDGAHARTGFSG